MLDQSDTTPPAPLAGGPAAEALESDEHVNGRLEVVRLVIAGAVALLALSTAATLLDGSVTWVDVLDAALVMVLGTGLLVHDRLTAMLADRRHSRVLGMTRILQGLSRSMSPEAVVEAIVAELRSTSGADHVVVARVSRPDHVVEVTLVTARANVEPSRTWLRPEVPELSTDMATDAAVAFRTSTAADPATAAEAPAREAPAREAAEEIARRVRAAYGLSYTLTAPLVADRRFLGALMLSRRTCEPWADPERRLLDWAAQEVAAAFSRTYLLEDAERGANLDALTGLPNRRYFDELLAIMGPRRRDTDSLGIMMIDIDHFKRLNDRYGHAQGDVVLKEVATAIARTLRAEDTPVRYGGEEFAVMLRRASALQASEAAERVRAAVAGLSIARLGLDKPVTVSVGVAIAAEDEEVSVVIGRADQALYRAKRRGRDRVELA
ncbi:MAG: sensor domain-containing diguanylate cyclase [Chloroflexi bacterium]|nr:sensor domain-containing diguanylate cyclase [Chloroflexota bacterium]